MNVRCSLGPFRRPFRELEDWKDADLSTCPWGGGLGPGLAATWVLLANGNPPEPCTHGGLACYMIYRACGAALQPEARPVIASHEWLGRTTTFEGSLLAREPRCAPVTGSWRYGRQYGCICRQSGRWPPIYSCAAGSRQPGVIMIKTCFERRLVQNVRQCVRQSSLLTAGAPCPCTCAIKVAKGHKLDLGTCNTPSKTVLQHACEHAQYQMHRQSSGTA